MGKGKERGAEEGATTGYQKHATLDKGTTKKVEAVEADGSLAGIASEHSGIADASRAETAKLHSGDLENRALSGFKPCTFFKTLLLLYRLSSFRNTALFGSQT